MKKPISPKAHGLADYALVGGLLVLPTVLGLNRKVKKIYAAEALALLAYVALTDHPTAVAPLIPFPVHGKIDPFNVANFAAHSLLKPFQRDKKALIFNTIFTAVSGAVVLLTDWQGKTKKHP